MSVILDEQTSVQIIKVQMAVIMEQIDTIDALKHIIKELGEKQHEQKKRETKA